jgi:NAD(P)H-hydrate epimerase
MKLFESKKIKEIDKHTIENEPIASIDLMERAANQLCDWVGKNIPQKRMIKMFAGTGNNGGDALALARLLIQKGYEVCTFLVEVSKSMSNDAMANLERLKQMDRAQIETISNERDLPAISRQDVIIEGIFGSGLSRPAAGIAAYVINYINNSGETIISIDIPSGLFGEDNTGNKYENIINATYTLSLEFPKLAFFLPENENIVGQWHVLPIGLDAAKIENTKTSYNYLTKNEVVSLLHDRKKFAHKGHMGHGLLIAGSYGKMGAAALGSKACLRTGIGLHTVHIPKMGVSVIQESIHEAMVSIDINDKIFSKIPPELKAYDAIGIGPGIGKHNTTANALKELLKSAIQPIVVDADGINILGDNPEWFDYVPENSVFTPHPKEFERIAGKTSNSYHRLKSAISFSRKYKIILALKGAYTCIVDPKGNCYFNTTGNPGMATAGSGDVLTGMILSLLAQKYEPVHAVKIAVYLHGLAGDLAASDKGHEALIASDIIKYISNGFFKLKG